MHTSPVLDRIAVVGSSGCLAMAYRLFGADLSLTHPDASLDVPTNASRNKDSQAGLIDFLGILPALETGAGPDPPAGSYKRCDSANNPQSISTQLTLFYAGTVNVFDNVTADKAQVVLSLAENSNSIDTATSLFKMKLAPSRHPSARYGLQLQDRMKLTGTETHENLQLQDPMKKTGTETHENLTVTAQLSAGERIQVSEDIHAQESSSFLVPCQAIVPKALPIARKESLARFLEKRKERARLMAPYLAKGSARNVIQQGPHHSITQWMLKANIGL